MSGTALPCGYCGQPTDDRCLGCGLPFERGHGLTPCPRCGRRSPGRGRAVERLVPGGRLFAAILVLLILGSLGVIGWQLGLAAGFPTGG